MAKKVINCLNPRLVQLYKKTLILEKLNKQIQSYLPDNIAYQIRSFNKGILVIQVNTPEAAYQLKFLLPSLREELRKKLQLIDLIAIKVEVMPIEIKTHKELKNTDAKPKRRSRDINEAINSLEETIRQKRKE